jgi:hypothetical protein
MSPDVHFPPGPFRGVSEEGESDHQGMGFDQANAQTVRETLML